jgi:hypothetical protein
MHVPDEITIGSAISTIFEEENIPAAYVSPWKHVDEEILKREIPNFDGRHKEINAVYAAARILGKEHLIPEPGTLRDEDPPEDEMLVEPVRVIREYGLVGHHYTHELQHVPQRAHVDVELGIEFLNDVAERLLPVVKALGDYVEWLEENPRAFITPLENV